MLKIHMIPGDSERWARNQQVWIDAKTKATSEWASYEPGQQLITVEWDDCPHNASGKAFHTGRLIKIHHARKECLVEFRGGERYWISVEQLAPKDVEGDLVTALRAWNSYQYSDKGHSDHFEIIDMEMKRSITRWFPEAPS
jgi:hypothetical protein